MILKLKFSGEESVLNSQIALVAASRWISYEVICVHFDLGICLNLFRLPLKLKIWVWAIKSIEQIWAGRSKQKRAIHTNLLWLSGCLDQYQQCLKNRPSSLGEQGGTIVQWRYIICKSNSFGRDPPRRQTSLHHLLSPCWKRNDLPRVQL